MLWKPANQTKSPNIQEYFTDVLLYILKDVKEDGGENCLGNRSRG